ncbi:hypothetical protein BB558_002654 [Smittium angustum]|uniref:Core-binding (CB) domain-containing protein n=1 Tax=Smittium angustum TaxID=133377 RepID=A0A2U1J8B2_SMIAN|nr:hypothetical protein BB558_002654 [Smittium angustum]
MGLNGLFSAATTAVGPSIIKSRELQIYIARALEKSNFKTKRLLCIRQPNCQGNFYKWGNNDRQKTTESCKVVMGNHYGIQYEGKNPAYSGKKQQISGFSLEKLPEPVEMEIEETFVSKINQKMISLTIDLFGSPVNNQLHNYYSKVSNSNALRTDVITSSVPKKNLDNIKLDYSALVSSIEKNGNKNSNQTSLFPFQMRDGGLENIQQKTLNLSEKAIALINQSAKSNTRKNYNSGWNKYYNWAKSNSLNSEIYDPTALANFIASLNQKPNSVSIITTAISEK